MQFTQRPTFSFVTRPASASTDRWWLTVGWLLPTGSSRSQLQAVPPGAAAMRDSSLEPDGVGQGLEGGRELQAAASASGSASSGAQHPRSWSPVPARVLLDLLVAHIDKCRYIDVCP